MSDFGLIRRVGVTLYGEPPPRDSPRSLRLRHIRRIHLRMLALAVPAYAFVLASPPGTWLLIVLGVGTLVWLENVLSLSVRIRREEKREAQFR